MEDNALYVQMNQADYEGNQELKITTWKYILWTCGVDMESVPCYLRFAVRSVRACLYGSDGEQNKI